MKLIATLSLLAATAASLFGQGSVNFNNRVTGVGGAVFPIYGPNPLNPTLSRSGNASTNGGSADYAGHPLLAGTGFTAELWGGNDAATLAPVAQVFFRTAATFIGFVQPPSSATIMASRPGGTPTVFQVRAWDNQLGTVNTWIGVLANNSIPRGMSEVTAPILLGTPPGTPPNLVGLTSFNLAVVPEPSLIALGALGLGALLLRRRKA